MLMYATNLLMRLFSFSAAQNCTYTVELELVRMAAPTAISVGGL